MLLSAINDENEKLCNLIYFSNDACGRLIDALFAIGVVFWVGAFAEIFNGDLYSVFPRQTGIGCQAMKPVELLVKRPFFVGIQHMPGT